MKIETIRAGLRENTAARVSREKQSRSRCSPPSSTNRHLSALCLAFVLMACTGRNPSGIEATNSGSSHLSDVHATDGCQVRPEELRKHSGGYCRGPEKDRVIVFVNGIFGDAVDTWSNKGAYWPALLAGDPTFSDTDIYVHSFDSPKIATAENIDELAGRMGDYLDSDAVFQKHKQVVFLCHSMGGLVTRAYLLKKRPNPSTVPMIYFFATPTTGANIAGIASHLSENPQLKYMLPIKEDGYVGDLQNAWLRTSDDPKVNYPNSVASFCAYEKLDTWGFRVVERQSATNLCNHETRAVLRDHLGIVKPASTTEEPYVYFKAAYLHTFGPVSAFIRTTLAAESQQSFALGTTREVTSQLGPETITIRGIKTFREYRDVGCEEERSGEVSATYTLQANQHIASVIPTVENINNLSSWSASLIRFDEKTAVVQYRIRGLNRTLLGLNCPGGGHADIVVNVAIISSRE